MNFPHQRKTKVSFCCSYSHGSDCTVPMERLTLYLMVRISPQGISCCGSVAQSCWLFSTLWTAARQASLSFTNSRLCSNSCPSSQWCHPTISSSVIPFSSSLQSSPASQSFPMSQLFPSGGQSTGVSASASVLLMNVQGWFPLRLTGLIFLLSKGLSRVFSSTTIQRHQFFGAQLSL